MSEPVETPHDHTLRKWTCGCDPWLLGIQEAARRTGNIELVVLTPAKPEATEQPAD